MITLSQTRPGEVELASKPKYVPTEYDRHVEPDRPGGHLKDEPRSPSPTCQRMEETTILSNKLSLVLLNKLLK